jgi:hypothetical protein
VDDKGATLYTDKPIPGAVLVSTGAQRPPEVAARNLAASQAASTGTLTASNQRIADSKNDSRVATNVAKDVEASRLERCKKAREQYQVSVNSHRLYKQTADGQRQYLTTEETDKARLDSAKQVEAICGPQG